MALRLEPGLGYVALGPAEATRALLSSLAASHPSYLWVTDRTQDPPANGGAVLRVTTLSGKNGTVDPKRLGDLRASAAAFVSSDASGLVILDPRATASPAPLPRHLRGPRTSANCTG